MRLAIFPDSPLLTIAVLVIGYLALMALTYLFQERLLYHPDGMNADAAGAFGLKPWPAPNDFHGFISSQPSVILKGTFLVWHGNAGSALHRAYFSEALERRGFRVVLMEYPGYCGRPGKLSESSFVSDALTAADKARAEFGIPVYLMGESLGCAVATAVARERSWVGGVALITPWDTLPDVAQAKFWYLPARFFVRDRYDNILNLVKYAGPVAVFLSENDEVVPRVHGQRLFNSIKSPKRSWLFKSAGHNSWPADPGERWWDELVDFIAKDNASETIPPGGI